MVKKISHRRIQRARDWLDAHRPNDFLDTGPTKIGFSKSLDAYAKAVPPSLKRAADTFGLDPEDPYHAAILLRMLAALVFSDGKKGRPHQTLKWGGQREFELGHRLYLLQQEKPGIKLTAAAKVIKLRWPKEYADSTETTLRQRMRSAYLFFEDVMKAQATGEL